MGSPCARSLPRHREEEHQLEPAELRDRRVGGHAARDVGEPTSQARKSQAAWAGLGEVPALALNSPASSWFGLQNHQNLHSSCAEFLGCHLPGEVQHSLDFSLRILLLIWQGELERLLASQRAVPEHGGRWRAEESAAVHLSCAEVS